MPKRKFSKGTVVYSADEWEVYTVLADLGNDGIVLGDNEKKFIVSLEEISTTLHHCLVPLLADEPAPLSSDDTQEPMSAKPDSPEKASKTNPKQ